MLRRLYEPAAYRAEALDGCYWTTTIDAEPYPSLDGNVAADVAVIGAGYTGLSAALHLARSGLNTVVVDAHGPGWGASGRNGGFACIGGAKLSRADMVARYGEEGRADWCRAERRAIDLVAELISEMASPVDRRSPGEVMLAHSPRAMEEIRAEVAEISADYDAPAEVIEPDGLAARGLSATGVHGGLYLPLGFSLNPRKYALGLAGLATAAGAKIHGNSPVAGITRDADGYRLDLPGGQLRAKRLVLATNGYSADNLPQWMRGRYLPVQSSVLVTRPLDPEDMEAQGWYSQLMAYDSRHLLHYFRLLPDRRFLFGMRGGIAWSAASHRTIRQRMQQHFAKMFPAWSGVEIEFFWSGLANLTRQLVPYVGSIGSWPNAVAAFGYHGNGVAMASFAGRAAAMRLLGETDGMPDFVSTNPTRFELGAARRLSLRFAYSWYGHLDRN